ncbi:MAG: hypothetical protein L3J83_05995, partial [Proteobacteria bacterium]|nr:hypothetical protein [Pseudomonadota bacterium]
MFIPNKVSGIFKVNGIDSIILRRGDGKQVLFTNQNNQWENISKTPETITKVGNQWIVNNNSEVETYNRFGNLMSYSRNGKLVNFEYKSGGSNFRQRLTKILSQDGRYVEFHYPLASSIEKIDYISDNTGREWYFNYNGYKLISISFPDNTTKTFHYENSSLLHALTGITDRRGIRYATYDYDAQGRVHHETHAGGVEDLSIVYNVDNTRIITNSRGKVSTYTVEKNNGRWQIKDISGPGCSSCSNANTNYIYDPTTNNLLSKTVDGRVTKYDNYDTKGQYGQKIEAFGTTEQHQTNYTYDPRFFKKSLTITEPSVYASNNKITTYSYDDNANILSMTESGFTADGTAISATTTYQYNGPYNQISQMNGPRTDVADITTFEYYPDDVSEGNNRGRLKQMTNAAGIVMRNNIQYTATGKILSEDKPNGLSTDYTYYAGNDRLQTVSNTDGTKTITTHMDYLASGEIKEITRNHNTANASTLTLDYDNARRLIKVTDQQGNYVQYELDTEGNQLSEKTYDPSNNLQKLITQVFDDYDQVDTSTQSGVTNNMDYG